jgi:hypothetical protein
MASEDKSLGQHVLIRVRNKTIAIVKNSMLLDQKSSHEPLPGRNGVGQNIANPPGSPMIIIHSTRSIDHMVDAALLSADGSSGKPAAAFIFAASQEASYAAKILDADITCINSVPSGLLVGTRYPRPLQSFQHSPGAEYLPPRYIRDMFEVVKPTIHALKSSSSTLLPLSLVEENDIQAKVMDRSQMVSRPLKPTGQRASAPEGSGAFFLRSLAIGAATIGVSALGLGYFLLRGYKWIV